VQTISPRSFNGIVGPDLPLNDRPRPFFLIPTPESESHPAIGVTFCVRLAGGPFHTASGYLLVLSFGIMGFCPHPKVGHPREAVNGPPDSKPP
jgi:hypothetical protein